MEDFLTLFEEANDFLKQDKDVSFECIETIKNKDLKDFIAVAQINTVVGNIKYNASKIAKYIKFANSVGLELIAFPELSLIGFPLEDAIDKFPFLAKESLKWLKSLAKLATKTVALVGFLEPIEGDSTKYYDSVAVLCNGVIHKIIRKELTSISEFNDFKYIEEYNSNDNKSLNFNVNNKEYSIIIGDEIFQKEKSFSDSATNAEKQNILINIASFRYTHKKEITKNINLSSLAKSTNSCIIQLNQVGTHDAYSFAGYSTVYNSSGDIIARANGYEERLLVVNPTKNIGKVYEKFNNDISNILENFSLDYSIDLERTYKALVLGVRDYFNKCNIRRAVLGLSGGLDSSVCAIILADAIGAKNVYGVSMPSHITSKESKSDARILAENLGINFTEASIKQMINTSAQCFDLLFKSVEYDWGKYWDDTNKTFTNEMKFASQSFTMDNIQARSRAMYLWGIANEFSSCIPIATSDKSELYMGYATINGDMSGGFAPIADVTKTKLFALARWMNENRVVKNAMPESIILKRPGAELAIDPKTGKPLIAEDALMPYEFLDEVIWRVEHNHQTYDELLSVQFIYEKNNLVTSLQKQEWLEKFFRRMSSALYKWSILPPSIVIEDTSINRNVYKQPITSSKVNYKRMDAKEIDQLLL